MKRQLSTKRQLFVLVLSLFISVTSIEAQWTQVGADIDGVAALNYLGNAISLSTDGSILAVGVGDSDANGTDSGQVRVYKYNSGTWTQIGDDINGEAGDKLGTSISINSDGSIIVAGAPYNDANGNNSGQVRIYKNNSGTWTQIGSINGEVAEEYSGISVDINSDGSIVVIGASGNAETETDAGQVRIYKNNSGTWTQIGDDINGKFGFENSGSSVSISSDGTIVAIGAPFNDGTAYDFNVDADYGAVRIYKNNSGTWTQIGDDINGNVEIGFFGISVSLNTDGSMIAIGASGAGVNDTFPGMVYVFKNTSGTWTQIGDAIEGESRDYAGYSVSLSSDGTIVAIGAPHANLNSNGQARVYKNDSGTWTRMGTYTDIDGEAAGDLSGSSVSLSSDGYTVAIGAPYNDGNGSNSGQVRVFKYNPVNISELKEAGISIYPNPSTGVFNIKSAKDYEITITDITGKVIYHHTAATVNEQIYLQQSGVYIINFKSQTKNFSSKIIVK